MPQQNIDTRLVNDLEQRIEQLQTTADPEFGGFTRLDWTILIIASIVLPTIALVVAQ
jgi:hypothetical protein